MVTTLTPSQGGFVWLNCLIEDEYRVFRVNVGLNDVVDDLKKSIQSERALSILKNIDPHTLELLKVSIIDDLRCEVTSPLSAKGPYRCDARRHSG